MPIESRELLRRLGAGESIAAVRAAAGMTEAEFDVWWRSELASRVPPASGAQRVGVSAAVRIERDQQGIPHVFAADDSDLFFGFGYAMAQDRLFQLDYLRRRGAGRLSEILGRSQLELDLTARTVGLPQIAAREWEQMPDETRRRLQAFSDGVNAWAEQAGDRIAIEFDLLNYRPEPWRPQDCLVIEGEFRWYLTGRFPVICVPELAKRALGGAGALYEAFLQPEAGDEAILPRGTYPSRARGSNGPQGANFDTGAGSNNWVVAGSRTDTGKPILASDPHIAFGAVSCWYEVHLRGGSFDVCGMAYAGIPAVMVGRNRRLAWGITNNICSLRDLYQEREDPAHPGCFLYDGRWEQAPQRTEEIRIRDAAPLQAVIRSSRNGPIVTDILPPAARGLGAVSLRWQGFEYCDWLSAMLRLNGARGVDEAQEAVRGWLVPTFSLVLADVDGHIAFRATGELPLRASVERGFRDGSNPADQWLGRIPWESMPHATDPERGFLVTANNRVAADDFPFPLSGTWSSGHRALRIRGVLTQTDRHSVNDSMRLHQDVLSLRAQACLPHLLRELENVPDARVQAARSILSDWDCRMDARHAAPAIFHVFFARWSRAVAEERLSTPAAELAAPAIGGLAAALLEADRVGWFRRPRSAVLAATIDETLDWLAVHLGDDLREWRWGKLHVMTQRHFLTDIGELSRLLDRGGCAVGGDGFTVCNTGSDDRGLALIGAGYRMVADLADPRAPLYAVDAGAQSGNPGSPHYDDQLPAWCEGRYHVLHLADDAEAADRTCFLLEPQ